MMKAKIYLTCPCILSLLKSQVSDLHFASLRNWQPDPAQPECQQLPVVGWFDGGRGIGPSLCSVHRLRIICRAGAILLSLHPTRGLFLLPIQPPHLLLALLEGFHYVLFSAPTGTAAFAHSGRDWPTSGAPAVDARRLGGRGRTRRAHLQSWGAPR